MTDQFAPPMKLGWIAAAAIAGLLLSLPASAQSVRRDVDGAQSQAQMQSQADAQQDRIEELQSQLAAATAQNESLQHQLSDAQRENQRLQAMVGNLASVNQDLSSGNAAPSPSPAGQNQVGQNQGQTQGAPNASSPGPGGGELSGGPAPQGQLGTLPASVAPPAPVDPGDLYSQALDQLKNGQYAEAESELADLLQNYPHANVANDARFWYAFTLLARHNDHDAAQNFIQFLHDAPNAARAPEAQVRLGMAFAEMGQTQQACTFYTNLPQRYPHAPRDIRALAVNEAARNHCHR
jgi:tol-pal system protein YbgF